MARVLVTGANGFTGRYLVDRLVQDDHELFGLVHSDDGGAADSLAGRVVADLRDHSAVERIVADLQPEIVVHLAAIANVAHGDVSDLYSSNVVGTRNLLHALSRQGGSPAKVMIASSANVYGNRRAGVLTEDMEPAPANDYGVSKVAGEVLAGVYADRLPIITVRPFNYTGRGQSENFLIPKIIGHLRRKAEVIELGNIDVARDFSDVRNVVDSYARLLSAPEAVGGVFNICSGEARTLAEVLDLAGRISGHEMKVQVNPAFVRSDEVRTLSGSKARVESVIGPVVMTDLSQTLAWMLDA
ncbi:MAG: NAD-dependent epimerase/dehydratase family protein [Novosphingobium sp.]|nr:NAD-dependent epimerase/dehydratase family protein [Novosphingobium sp.]